MHKVLILLPRNLGRGDGRKEGRREVGGWDGWTDLSWQKADSMPLWTDHRSCPAKPISPPIPHGVTCKTKHAVDLGSHHQFWSSEKWGLWKVNQISGSSLGVQGFLCICRSQEALDQSLISTRTTHAWGRVHLCFPGHLVLQVCLEASLSSGCFPCLFSLP